MISSRYIWPLCNLRLFPYLHASPQICVQLTCVRSWQLQAGAQGHDAALKASPSALCSELSFLVAADEPRQPQFVFTTITFWWLDLLAATLESLYDFSRISLLFIQFPVKPLGCFCTFAIWETEINLFMWLIRLLVLPIFFSSQFLNIGWIIRIENLEWNL